MDTSNQSSRKSNLVEFAIRQPAASFGRVCPTLDEGQVSMFEGVSANDLEAFMQEVLFNVSREPIINSQFHIESETFINGCVLMLHPTATSIILAGEIVAVSTKGVSTIAIGELRHKMYANSPKPVMMRVAPVEVKKTKTIHNIVFDVVVYITDKFNTYILHHFIGKVKIGGTVKTTTKSAPDWKARFNSAISVDSSDDVGYLKAKFSQRVQLNDCGLRRIDDILLVGFYSIQSMFAQAEATVVNVQEIDSKSNKRFLKRNVGISKGSVAAFPAVCVRDMTSPIPTFVICEGVATGISLHLALSGGGVEDSNAAVLCCGSTSLLSPTLLILIARLAEMLENGGKRHGGDGEVFKKVKVVIAGENDSNMSSKKAIGKCLKDITVPEWMEITVVFPHSEHNDFNDMLTAEMYPSHEISMGLIKQLVLNEATDE